MAGQYSELTVPGLRGMSEPRCYSFAEAPDRASLRRAVFHVRHVPGGAFTDWLFAGDRTGARLGFSGPHGRFRYHDSGRPLLCVAGGTGFAPIKAILEQGLLDGLTRDVTLVVGARTRRDLYALDAIGRMKERWRGRFTFVPMLSDEPEGSGWRWRRGHVTDYLREAAECLADHAAYVCGPPGMIDAALDVLRGRIPPEHLHHDRFFNRGSVALASASNTCRARPRHTRGKAIMSRSTLFTFGFMALFAAVEHAFGVYRRPGVLTMRELGTSLLSAGITPLVRGAIAGAVVAALRALWPGSEGALAGVSFWLVCPLFVLFDEYVNYWVHRKSHEWPWLWRIHKAHHTAQEMNVAVALRGNWPGLLPIPYVWLFPALLWLGQPHAYMAALAFKTLIGLTEHCDLRWDLPLQRNRFTRPVMWVLERILTLPDTHHAHHGVGRHSNAMKNFGVTLSFFDLVHGTLLIPHARQERFGLPEGAPVGPWTEQLFWPFVPSTKNVVDRRRPIGEASPAAALAAATAVIHTADGRTVVVG